MVVVSGGVGWERAVTKWVSGWSTFWMTYSVVWAWLATPPAPQLNGAPGRGKD